jgi:hypothetical protein
MSRPPEYATYGRSGVTLPIPRAALAQHTIDAREVTASAELFE